MEHYRPRYLIHGHIHLYNPNERRITQHGSTTVLNAFGYQVLEIDPYKPKTTLATEK